MFDFNKISDFEKHISLSIPNYEWLHKQVEQYAEYFIEPGTQVLDIGCSTGRLLKSLPKIKDVAYVGVDNSNLLPESDEDIEFISSDLRDFDAYSDSNLIFSLFTLQFLPRVLREIVLARIKDGLRSKGAFIMCEKTYASTSRLQDITNSLYYEYKREKFTEAEILNKEIALRSSMRLYTLDDLVKQMKQIGTVDVFWRSYNFVGLIAVKD